MFNKKYHLQEGVLKGTRKAGKKRKKRDCKGESAFGTDQPAETSWVADGIAGGGLEGARGKENKVNKKGEKALKAKRKKKTACGLGQGARNRPRE